MDADRKRVRVKLALNTWFVEFVDRKKGQLHSAAHFAADQYSKEFVVAWIKSKPHLELVEEQEKEAIP